MNYWKSLWTNSVLPRWFENKFPYRWGRHFIFIVFFNSILSAIGKHNKSFWAYWRPTTLGSPTSQEILRGWERNEYGFGIPCRYVLSGDENSVLTRVLRHRLVNFFSELPGIYYVRTIKLFLVEGALYYERDTKFQEPKDPKCSNALFFKKKTIPELNLILFI